MGEAIISRGFSGSNGGGTSGENGNFRTEIITTSTLWKVPENLKDGTVSVRIFGGGGGGNMQSFGGGGGGGHMNNATIDLKGQSEVYITIGSGGPPDTYGGTTSFGTYLSAFGGQYGSRNSGGNGGSGGAGNMRGGIGYQFGGGSGISRAGDGGKWGGGGSFGNNKINATRGGCLYENSQNRYEITGYSGLGGNGGNGNHAEDGINTIGMGLDFEGDGKIGVLIKFNTANNNSTTLSAGMGAKCGGGGYGGNGGSVLAYAPNLSLITFSSINAYGGGGGYGADGGNGCAYFFNSFNRYFASGGGGGYGGPGGSGGYFKNIDFVIYGGGGGYGKYGQGGGYDMVNECLIEAGIAAGGHGVAGYATGGYGGDGICIIQYYVK